MDIKTLNSAISSLEYDKHQMSSKIRLLSEQKDNELNDLRSTLESDRKAQTLSAESIIASKEQELESTRSANGELRGQIKKLSDETAQLHMSCERYDSELKQCQEEVSALKVKLSEATRDSQEKASNLAEHYMKIEDELRMQLNTARQEKDTVEQQLAADRKETDRLMDDFYSQKQELTSRNIELTEKLDTIMKERDSLQNQAELQRSATISDEEYLKSKEKEIETLEYELQNAQEEARKCREIAERADRQATALKEVATQHSKGLELANNDLEDSKRVLELERIAHANQLSDLQATYETELDKDRMTLKSSKERVDVLTFENNSLEEAVVSLRSRINKMEKTKLHQEAQIAKLETSLNNALDEAVRLGSKMDMNQMRHVEVTQSLTGVEHEHTLFNDRISKLSAEKSNLQGQLIDKEKQLFEALNSLTHFELKLTKAEQERDRRDRESEKAHEDITRLEQTLSRLEEENQELLGHISILQKDSNADSLYKELLEKMKVKEMQREEELREMNAKNDSLKTRLAVLTKEKNAIEGVNNKKISALQSSLESIKQQVLKRQKSSDDASTASSRTAKSGLRQTVLDLEDSVDAIKIHYEKKVHSLQHELDSARKRIVKYEHKISELSTLLEENASILNAVFHKQLKNKQNLPRSPPAVLQPSESGEITVDSEVS
jgi:chromosome segregation ATPase